MYRIYSTYRPLYEYIYIYTVHIYTSYIHALCITEVIFRSLLLHIKHCPGVPTSGFPQEATAVSLANEDRPQVKQPGGMAV